MATEDFKIHKTMAIDDKIQSLLSIIGQKIGEVHHQISLLKQYDHIPVDSQIEQLQNCADYLTHAVVSMKDLKTEMKRKNNK